MIVNIMCQSNYRESPLPPEEECSTGTTLDTFGESLSILYYFQTRADFWVMKECGAKVSWTKLFTIPFTIELPCHNRIEPLCFSVDGDIILLSGSSIVLYSPKKNEFKNLLDFYDDKLYVHTYVESLVKPPKLAEENEGLSSYIIFVALWLGI